jgi:hypothetical protein
MREDWNNGIVQYWNDGFEECEIIQLNSGGIKSVNDDTSATVFWAPDQDCPARRKSDLGIENLTAFTGHPDFHLSRAFM